MPDGSQVGRSASTALLTLPNVITFARLCAVPLSVWLVLEHQFAQAFFLFVAAGLSDAVDGWLARRSGGGNMVGALLDPVADKALLVTMYVTLASVEALPDWLAILVVFRDVVIVGGVVVLSLLGQSVLIRPLYISKLNTVLQIVLVALTLLLSGFDLAAPAVMTGLIWLVAATTLGSGAAYVWVTVTQQMTDTAELPPPEAPPPPAPRTWFAEVATAPGQATRGQRVALVVGLLVVAWLALQLFASVLAPFVAAAGIAYVLDPPTTRLTRLGLGRGLAALLMILGLIAVVLLFALLLYPLILQQIGLLLGRIPQYVQLLQRWASTVLTDLQQNFGSDVVNDKLRDLVSSQAGNMLSFIASSLTSVIGSGLRDLQRADARRGDAGGGLLSAARLAACDRHGRFLAAASLRRRDPCPGPRGGPHPVSLGARAGAVLHDPGALLRLRR